MTIKLTARAKREVEAWNLADNLDYTLQLHDYVNRYSNYVNRYSKRPPGGAPDRNMIVALRLLPRLNTPDDWARLHAAEVFIRRR